MRKLRVFVAVQFALGVAATAAMVWLSPSTVEWMAVGAFASAFVVLGVFDVWLPRGDPADMTGAIVFASGALLSPASAATVVIVSRALLTAFRPRRAGVLRMVDDTGRQLLVLACAEGLRWWLGGWNLGTPIAEYLVVAAAAVLFFVLDFLLLQVRTSIRLGTPLLGLVVGNLRLQGWMSAAEVSAAVLCVVIYEAMSVWGLVIVVCLLLVMRQAFALLMEVRLAYRSTVEVLARAMEAQDPGRRSHGERVASLATNAGRMLGLHGAGLESLHYAALFHDVGRLGQESPVELQGTSSADILGNVGFLSKAVPILAVLESPDSVGGSQSEGTLVSAYVIARMSELDDELSIVPMIGPRPSDSVGARLYAETRREIDRAVHRVEVLVRSGRLSLETPGEDFG